MVEDKELDELEVEHMILCSAIAQREQEEKQRRHAPARKQFLREDIVRLKAKLSEFDGR